MDMDRGTMMDTGLTTTEKQEDDDDEPATILLVTTDLLQDLEEQVMEKSGDTTMGYDVIDQVVPTNLGPNQLAIVCLL